MAEVKEKKKKESVFAVPGVIHPKDYDWKKAFRQVAGTVRRTADSFISYDSKKFCGLLLYLEELETRCAVLEAENVRLKEKDSAKKK